MPLTAPNLTQQQQRRALKKKKHNLTHCTVSAGASPHSRIQTTRPTAFLRVFVRWVESKETRTRHPKNGLALVMHRVLFSFIYFSFFFLYISVWECVIFGLFVRVFHTQCKGLGMDNFYLKYDFKLEFVVPEDSEDDLSNFIDHFLIESCKRDCTNNQTLL